MLDIIWSIIFTRAYHIVTCQSSVLLMSDQDYHDKAHITQGYLSGLMNELGRLEKVTS